MGAVVGGGVMGVGAAGETTDHGGKGEVRSVGIVPEEDPKSTSGTSN